VDPRSGLGNVEEKRILHLAGLDLRFIASPTVASRYTDCAISAHNFVGTKFNFANIPGCL
jgi:hypothetical protein